MLNSTKCYQQNNKQLLEQITESDYNMVLIMEIITFSGLQPIKN